MCHFDKLAHEKCAKFQDKKNDTLYCVNPVLILQIRFVLSTIKFVLSTHNYCK